MKCPIICYILQYPFLHINIDEEKIALKFKASTDVSQKEHLVDFKSIKVAILIR